MTSTLERATALPPLQLGGLTVDPAVVLAPMAGITNPPFRTLCREFGAGPVRLRDDHYPGAGRAQREDAADGPSTPASRPRSRAALRRRPGDRRRGGADAGRRGVPAPAHIDLNFGCPVPKVTRKGGGAALPWRAASCSATSSARRSAAAPATCPVTVKMRIGIDDDHVTYLDAGPDRPGRGRRGDHAARADRRPALQRHRRLGAIARLKDAVDIPVLGNGDIWEADDALRMVAETGCAGVVVGRGCLGRPWLFGDLAAAFAGRPAPAAARPRARSPR